MDVVLVDEKDRVRGYREKFAAHKHPVTLHRAISVVIFDPGREKMLLQKRAKSKPTWPLYWSNACCTHPKRGESYEKCASRRLAEEMGFEAPLERKYEFTYKADYDDEWGENEYDVVFEGTFAGQVKPDPEEAADYKWMEVRGLLKDVGENPDSYTPWFKLILEHYRE